MTGRTSGSPPAERALSDRAGRIRESADLFRLLVESVRDYAIFMLDPDGFVVTWNVGAERIKGYRASEIVGQHFSRFYPEEDVRAGKCERELHAAARDGRFEDEGWRLRKDGSRFWANVIISAVRDAGGKLVGFSKVTRDLTELKRVQEEQAARFAAEQSNRVKDDFLAVLGHELRNPLAPIATALQLLKLRGFPPCREQQIIERQVHHMIRLVDDLLDISRITRGKIELRSARIDLRGVIGRAVEIASPLLERRGHHLDIDVPPREVVIDADADRLTQVLANLLTNAAKYTDPGGHIRVAVRRAGGEVVVEVRDDGIGIAPELLPRLFELFVQGPDRAERRAGGLGIGLSLARKLVEMHGGRVEAQSAGPGQGSTFSVHLRAAQPDAGEAAASAASAGLPRADHPRRILVVDDNEDGLALLADFLAASGHEVVTAADAAAALLQVQRFAPEIAVVDIGLPGMDGYDLAAQIRAETPGGGPVLIALTGYGQNGDQERSRNAGFHRHLVKPIDLQVLMHTIAEIPAR